MQHRAAIMHGHVPVDARLQRGAIDLDAAEVENKSVTQRRVDVISLIGRGELGWRPEHGLPDGVRDAVRQRGGRPMTERSYARKGNLVVGVALRPDMTVEE